MLLLSAEVRLLVLAPLTACRYPGQVVVVVPYL